MNIGKGDPMQRLRNTQEHDKRKNTYAENNKIPLLRINCLVMLEDIEMYVSEFLVKHALLP